MKHAVAHVAVPLISPSLEAPSVRSVRSRAASQCEVCGKLHRLSCGADNLSVYICVNLRFTSMRRWFNYYGLRWALAGYSTKGSTLL